MAVEDSSPLQSSEFVAAILSLPQSYWVSHWHTQWLWQTQKGLWQTQKSINENGMCSLWLPYLCVTNAFPCKDPLGKFQISINCHVVWNFCGIFLTFCKNLRFRKAISLGFTKCQKIPQEFQTVDRSLEFAEGIFVFPEIWNFHVHLIIFFHQSVPVNCRIMICVTQKQVDHVLGQVL